MAPSNFTESFEKDLRLKNYCESSIGNYVSQVKMFLFAFKQKDSPKHISESEILNTIEKLEWDHFTSCAIAADLDDTFFIVASKGHSGCGFIKSIQVSRFSNKYAPPVVQYLGDDAEKMVSLAYKKYENQDFLKRKLEEALNAKNNGA